MASGVTEELQALGKGTNMRSILEMSIHRYPERLAVVDPVGDVRYTYGDFADRIYETAEALSASKIGHGDPVGVIAENRVELLTLFWATQSLGAVFVPMNFRTSADEISFLSNNVEAELLFFSSTAKADVVDAIPEMEVTEEFVYFDDDAPEVATPFGSFIQRGDDSPPRTHPEPSDTSLILHTSGTTGKPKGVPISHRANYARTVGNPINLGWRLFDSTLGIMPNFHEMGRAAITSTVLLGGSYVAMRKWDVETGLRYVEDEGITMLYLVPTLFHDIVDFEHLDDFDVSSVSNVGYAGTAMSERVHLRVWEVFDPDVFTNFLGSSEMNAMAICNWLDEKPGCAGRGGIHTRVRVVTPVEGETVPPDETVERGELGEVIVDASTPEAFDGYLNRPEANETSFEGGWYFTGDLGYLDDDGDLWVVGRVDDMIISGGENIYPVEIEDVLDGHELVADVAVGSVADERLGEIVTAYVHPGREAGDEFEKVADELDRFVKDSPQIADFKRPRKYIFAEGIPQSQVGKKLRRLLRVDDVSDLDVEVLAVVDV